MKAANLNALFVAYKHDQGAGLDPLLAAVRHHVVHFLQDEDASQEFVIDLWPVLSGLKEEGSFAWWLNRRLNWHRANTFRQVARERKRFQQTPLMYGDDDEPLSDEESMDVLIFRNLSKEPNPDPEPDLDCIEDPTIRQVAGLMLDGYTQEEAAVKVDVKPATLRKRLQRYRDAHSLPMAA